MARTEHVECEIEIVELENDSGRIVDGVSATCLKCGYETTAFGTEAISVRRCLATMREECPEGERNFYVATGGEDEDE